MKSLRKFSVTPKTLKRDSEIFEEKWLELMEKIFLSHI